MISLDAARVALFHYTINDDSEACEIWRQFCKNSTQAERVLIFKQAMNDAFRFNHGKKTEFNYERTNDNGNVRDHSSGADSNAFDGSW